MRTYTLEQLSEKIDYGFTASAVRKRDGPRFLRITDIQNGDVDWGQVPGCECSNAEMERFRVADGDIVFARTGATTGKSFLIEKVPECGVLFASYLIRLRPRRTIYSPYLAHFFKTPQYWRQITTNSNGSAQPGVNASKLGTLSVPIPSLQEQKRIAAILDKADAIRRKRERSIRLADEFLRSLFLDMFDDPVNNPRGWLTASIGELGVVVTGNTPPRENEQFFGGSLEWIKSDNLNTPKHIATRATEFLSELGRLRARSVPAGSILVTCIAGTPDCIGNAAIIDREVAFNQQINAVIPGPKIKSQFLYGQFLVAKQLIQRASTESMKGMVSKGRFERIRVIVPPVDMQENFSRQFTKILSFTDRAENLKRASEALQRSLTHLAFIGELLRNNKGCSFRNFG